MGNNISQQSEKEGNSSQDLEQDITSLNDKESDLSETPKKPLKISSGSIEDLRQSSRARAPRTLYSGQITYGSTRLSNRLFDIPGQPDQNLDSGNTPSSLARFTNTRVLQSHVYMVPTLRMLEINIDKKDNNEPNSLIQAMNFSDRPK